MTCTTSKYSEWSFALSRTDLNLRNRFGNFIGEEAESEAASEAGVDANDYIYDDEQDEAPSHTGQELMELDGKAQVEHESIIRH